MTHLIYIFSIFSSIPQLNKKYPFYIFSFITLFMFLALRYDYGNDYMAYYEIHTKLNSGIEAWGSSDILFKYLNLLIPNYFVFIATISFIYIVVIYFVIKRNLKISQYWFALLILLINPRLLLIHASAIRQTLAILMFIIAVNFAIKRRKLLYVIFIFIAVGMHSSAIILFPIYFLLNEKKIKKRGILIVVFSIFILLFTPIFNYLAYNILEYMPINYMNYFENADQNSIRATILSSFYFFLVIFNIDKLTGKEIIFGKLYLIGTIISILAMRVSMLTRIGMYFEVFSIIAIPILFSKIKKKLYRQLLFGVMIAIYLLRYYSFFTNPMWSSFVHYKTILGY